MRHPIDVNQAKIAHLEGLVYDLTKALEWHVGVSLRVMRLEEELISLRVSEHKERGERFGEDGEQVAQQTCDGINQLVNQKLNNDVSSDTDQGQDS